MDDCGYSPGAATDQAPSHSSSRQWPSDAAYVVARSNVRGAPEYREERSDAAAGGGAASRYDAAAAAVTSSPSASASERYTQPETAERTEAEWRRKVELDAAAEREKRNARYPEELRVSPSQHQQGRREEEDRTGSRDASRTTEHVRREDRREEAPLRHRLDGSSPRPAHHSPSQAYDRDRGNGATERDALHRAEERRHFASREYSPPSRGSSNLHERHIESLPRRAESMLERSNSLSLNAAPLHNSISSPPRGHEDKARQLGDGVHDVAVRTKRIEEHLRESNKIVLETEAKGKQTEKELNAALDRLEEVESILSRTIQTQGVMRKYIENLEHTLTELRKSHSDLEKRCGKSFASIERHADALHINQRSLLDQVELLNPDRRTTAVPKSHALLQPAMELMRTQFAPHAAPSTPSTSPSATQIVAPHPFTQPQPPVQPQPQRQPVPALAPAVLQPVAQIPAAASPALAQAPQAVMQETSHPVEPTAAVQLPPPVAATQTEAPMVVDVPPARAPTPPRVARTAASAASLPIRPAPAPAPAPAPGPVPVPASALPLAARLEAFNEAREEQAVVRLTQTPSPPPVRSQASGGTEQVGLLIKRIRTPSDHDERSAKRRAPDEETRLKTPPLANSQPLSARVEQGTRPSTPRSTESVVTRPSGTTTSRGIHVAPMAVWGTVVPLQDQPLEGAHLVARLVNVMLELCNEQHNGHGNSILNQPEVEHRLLKTSFGIYERLKVKAWPEFLVLCQRFVNVKLSIRSDWENVSVPAETLTLGNSFRKPYFSVVLRSVPTYYQQVHDVCEARRINYTKYVHHCFLYHPDKKGQRDSEKMTRFPRLLFPLVDVLCENGFEEGMVQQDIVPSLIQHIGNDEWRDIVELVGDDDSDFFWLATMHLKLVWSGEQMTERRLRLLDGKNPFYDPTSNAAFERRRDDEWQRGSSSTASLAGPAHSSQRQAEANETRVLTGPKEVSSTAGLLSRIGVTASSDPSSPVRHHARREATPPHAPRNMRNNSSHAKADREPCWHFQNPKLGCGYGDKCNKAHVTWPIAINPYAKLSLPPKPITATPSSNGNENGNGGIRGENARAAPNTGEKESSSLDSLKQRIV